MAGPTQPPPPDPHFPSPADHGRSDTDHGKVRPPNGALSCCGARGSHAASRAQRNEKAARRAARRASLTPIADGRRARARVKTYAVYGGGAAGRQPRRSRQPRKYLRSARTHSHSCQKHALHVRRFAYLCCQCAYCRARFACSRIFLPLLPGICVYRRTLRRGGTRTVSISFVPPSI